MHKNNSVHITHTPNTSYDSTMTLLIIIHLISGLVCLFAQNAPDTLRQVNVLYRHGDRTPVRTYPNDPITPDTWPQGLGWLTKEGMRQQYALGQFLRKEYDGFLNATYKNTEIVVQASNVNRCLMSAYCNLAGLYPPVKDQEWNDKLAWQPIPVHTEPEVEDNKLAMDKPCVRYDELYAKELKSPVVIEEETVNAGFYDLVVKHSGVIKENITSVWKLADTLFVEKTHNLTLPNWTQMEWKNETIYSRLMELHNFSFDLLFNGTQRSRLKGGPLLKEIIQNMQTAANESAETRYKMHMYSAHDTTVASLLGAMSVFNRVSPPYATAVLVELHQSSDDYCVKIRLRNSTQEDPYILTHPQCGGLECCPLDKFIEATQDRVPGDWDTECGNVVTESGSLMTGTVLALSVLIGVVCIFFLILAISYCKQRRVIRTFENV